MERYAWRRSLLPVAADSMQVRERFEGRPHRARLPHLDGMRQTPAVVVLGERRCVSPLPWTKSTPNSLRPGCLLMRQALGSLAEQVPGWQRELMTHPGLIPPPLQGLFTGRSRTQYEAGERFMASTDDVERAGGAVAGQW